MSRLVAEIGANHMGNIKVAKDMIWKAAYYCKCDYVKFQKRTLELMSEEDRNRPYDNQNSFGKTYGEHREKLEFDIEQHKELSNFAKLHRIRYACSVWDIEAAKQITSIEPAYIKIPSACNTNFDMIGWLVKNYNGMIHVSMGMTDLTEKTQIRSYISRNPQRFVVYHCVSAYPVNFDDVFLSDISLYHSGWGLEFGYSGHHKGIAVDIAAIAMGAQWIERHFTLDRTWKGTDQSASLEPDGMRKLARDIRNVRRAMRKSDGDIKGVEWPARKKLKR